MLVRRLGRCLAFATVHSNRLDGETESWEVFTGAVRLILRAS